MTTATLRKWGNGAGLYVPKEAVEILGLSIGQEAVCAVDIAATSITYDFAPKRRYTRHQKLTMDDLLVNWDGTRTGTGEIIEGTIGSEVIA